MAGRLDGFVDGRPVSVLAENNAIVLHASLMTLLKLGRTSLHTLTPFRGVVGVLKVRLLVRLGWLGEVELFPHPNSLVRLLMPHF